MISETYEDLDELLGFLRAYYDSLGFPSVVSIKKAIDNPQGHERSLELWRQLGKPMRGDELWDLFVYLGARMDTTKWRTMSASAILASQPIDVLLGIWTTLQRRLAHRSAADLEAVRAWERALNAGTFNCINHRDQRRSTRPIDDPNADPDIQDVLAAMAKQGGHLP